MAKDDHLIIAPREQALEFKFKDDMRNLYLKYAENAEVNGVPVTEFKESVFRVLIGLFLANSAVGTDGLDPVEKAHHFKANLTQFHNFACELFVGDQSQT